MGAPLNVVYLKTSEPDFYLFSNCADLGFEPYAEVLAQDTCCTLVVTGRFKLKRTRKRLRNRLDIYMTAESGKSLGMDIYRAYGQGAPRKSQGDPDSTWNGETRVPSMLSKYFTKCRGLVASAGGRSIACRDANEKTRVYIDLEEPREEYSVMSSRETHIAVALDGNGTTPAISPSFREMQKTTLSLAEQAEERERGLDPTVYGHAFGSIAVEFGIESAKDFGSALNLLKWELDNYHNNGDASTLR
ncbi:MAG: hypothetical protein UC328_08765 [Adlercreutzia sp.]|nr:hypothetical protein [Adlercreutzia sp.]